MKKSLSISAIALLLTAYQGFFNGTYGAVEKKGYGSICNTLDSGYYIPPGCFAWSDSLGGGFILCPPLDSTSSIPSNFVGYNIYQDQIWYDFISPTITFFQPYWIEMPGIYQFELSAVYDLTPNGLPGETGESSTLMTLACIRFGHNIPFYEDWNSGNFDENMWENECWNISVQTGHPVPATSFGENYSATEYDCSLTSFPLLGDSMLFGNIYLEFDLKLSTNTTNGEEKLDVMVIEMGSEYTTYASFSNAEAGFDWKNIRLDISPSALGKIFWISFRAYGSNTANLGGWFIDNIHVYRDCQAPQNLEVNNTYSNGIEVTWDEIFNDSLLYWDDGTTISSIGTGGPVEFDVAARWEPDQLLPFTNGVVKQVSFFPNENNASYRIRVWQGAGAQTMLADQPVSNPVIGEWNAVDLTDPLPIDIFQELWIGYYVEADEGYPAGVDEGPAVDGYGNMMNYGGWQTLLQINPELDHNWNIRALVDFPLNDSTTINYALYRQDGAGPVFLRAVTVDNYFLDDSICDGQFLHTYKVKAILLHSYDTCESEFSNAEYEICQSVEDLSEDLSVSVYPNPVSEWIQIVSNKMIHNVSLFSNHGQQLSSIKINSAETILPVNGYPPGLYLLRIETVDFAVSRKVTILR
jgi:hypothetical protein